MDEPTNLYWPHFSEEEYARRDAKIRSAMREEELDALIVYGVGGLIGTDPYQANVVYIARYAAFTQTYVVFPIEGEPTLFIPWDYQVANAKKITRLKDVRPGSLAQITDRVADRLDELGLASGRIGVVGASLIHNISLPREHFEILERRLPGAELPVVTRWFERIYMVKSEEEIAFIRRGAGMTDAVHEVLFQATRPGKRPSELFDVVLSTAHAMGGRIPFGHIGATPMADPEMVYPDPYAMTRPMRKGDVVLTELAVGYGGYFGKVWATYFIGPPTPRYERLFEAAVRTRREVYAAVKPGRTVREIKPALTRAIREAGFHNKTLLFGWGNYNVGIGVRVVGDEVTQEDFRFEAGQCMSVASWPIAEPDRCGIWLGDCAIVTQGGLENLQRYPLEEIRVVPA
ncbi:MAG: M24 family metallopeptidase [Nitrospinota bacterium]